MGGAGSSTRARRGARTGLRVGMRSGSIAMGFLAGSEMFVDAVEDEAAKSACVATEAGQELSDAGRGSELAAMVPEDVDGERKNGSRVIA